MIEKVSVIIPTYNLENYIGRCLESVINQSYSNLEIIVVNDGSTDNTQIIAEQYLRNDSRIIVINQDNMGLSGARNTGLDVSTGDYIYLLDADDFINPNTIYKLLKIAIENKGLVIVAGDHRIVYDSEMVDGDENIDDYLVSSINKDQVQLNICEGLAPYGVVWNKLFDKRLFNNLRFAIGKRHEDEYIMYKLYDIADSIIFYSYPTYYYYQRKGSIMNSNFNERDIDAYYAYKERVEYFLNKNKVNIALKNQKMQYYAFLKYMCRKYNSQRALDLNTKIEFKNNINNYLKNETINLPQKILMLLIFFNNNFLDLYFRKVYNVNN